MITLHISKKQLETIGDGTLVGMLVDHPQFFATADNDKQIVIKFEQSTPEQIRNRPGPDFVLIPEYVIPILFDGVRFLEKNHWNVTIERYDERTK